MMTDQQARNLPVGVDLCTAASALGIGRTTADELVRTDRWPTPILRLGNSIRIPTAPLLHLLGLSTAPSDDEATRVDERSDSAMSPDCSTHAGPATPTLRAALNQAVKRRLIDRNPALLVELAQGRRPRAVLWTDERVSAWQTRNLTLAQARDDERAAAHTAKIVERRAASHPAGRAARSAARAATAAHQAAGEALHDAAARVERPVVALWTPAQTGAFLDAAAVDRLYAIYHLIALRGLRRGEATGLPWVNVNLEDGEVIIDTLIVQIGWVTQTTSPKAGSEGTIALDALTIAALRGHRERQDAEPGDQPGPTPGWCSPERTAPPSTPST